MSSSLLLVQKTVIMMKQLTVSLIFLSTFAVLSFGQQTEQQTTRKLDAFQLFEIQRGEVENFKTLIYRFEEAWVEADMQSMTDLRAGLLELMSLEIKQMEEKELTTNIQKARLDSAKSTKKELEKNALSNSNGDLGKRVEATIDSFHDFIRLLESDLDEQHLALRSNN